MKYCFTAILIIVTVSLKAQSITAEQAKNYIGKPATVCGTVAGIFTSDKSGITFISMGADYPKNTFTIVVFKDAVAKFSYRLSTLKNKSICVTGKIKNYKGKPEIVADNESQIKMQ